MTSTDAFPRGGFKPTANADPSKKKPQRQENLFGNVQQAKKQKTKKRRRQGDGDIETATVHEFIDKTDKLSAVSADTLSYKKIHEGMSILASVKQINTMTVNVELPGRCYADILVQNISSGYSQQLSEAVKSGGEDLPLLEDYLQVGMFLPVKVLDLEDGEKARILVSCDPNDINSHYKHADFTKHMLVWGAVKEKSDHGYLIDLGVKNCRAHLPFTELDNDKDLPVGKVLYMVVTKSASSKEATTLTLSATKQNIEKTVESMGTSLDKTLPGMQVSFLVQKQLKDGLQGQYFDECAGFINDLYLQKPFENVKKYKEFTTIKARLLYVQPVSKLGYFTLKSLHEMHPEEKFEVGDWITSTVFGRAGSGLVVKLQGGFKGFITLKRLLHTINMKQKEQEDLPTLIANKFPNGSTRHCTILDYYHMERLFICTFEQITEFINVRQLSLAQVVKGMIKSINNYGMVIRLGKLEGFVPKDNISNVRFSQNIMKQFKVGQEVTAKVWNLNKKEIILTLKPELLQSNIHLTSYKDISFTEQYPGVVITTNATGVLLLFYGGVKGWLPKRSIPQLGNKHPSNEFYNGQVVKARATHCDDEKLTLTLHPPVQKRLRVGTVITRPKITKITDDGLFVKTSLMDAFVPKEQLAVEGLGKLMLSTFKVNTVLEEDLICVAASNPPILSVREYVVHQRQQRKTPMLSELKPNVVMRVVVKSKNMLYVPVTSAPESFIVADKMLHEVPIYETIVAKVATAAGKKVTWKFRLDDVFDYSVEETLHLLDQYLNDVERLKNQLRQIGNSLGDLEVGATVDCVVNQVDPHRGCSVSVVPMQCQGLVSLNDCPDKLEAGSQIQGKVLWVNYEYAAITLKPDIMQKIGNNQEKNLKKLLKNKEEISVEILHANRHVAVGVLGAKFNRKLIYLPVKLHENDVKPTVNVYDAFMGEEVSVKLQKMPSGRLLAVTKTMAATLSEKQKKCGPMVILCKTAKEIQKDQLKAQKKVLKKMQEKVEEIKDEDEGIESAEEIKSETASIKSEPDDDQDVDVVMKDEVEEESEEDDDIEDSKPEEDGDMVEDSQPEDEEMNETEDKQVEIPEETKSKKKKRKLEKLNASKEKVKKLKVNSDEEEVSVVLPGMSSFFKEEAPIEIKQESDDETDTTVQKKKLTPAERLQKIKDEEARLRKIENELADASVLPQNAEQYDRALLGNPDDSELWTRYIAFHAQSTEFDKARTVARRAIERISFTALQDRLNVWLAYLNLENMYGMKESFKSLFDEAARCNDALTIYLESIKMMSEMGKFAEMEELIKKARGKFKQELQMWLEIGKVYYKCGKFAEARRVKDKALLALVDKKSHIQLIVQFGIMEFTFGESTEGEALFETMLQADPKRVDIWCTYVDQLIKKEKIDLARNVLTRAVGQKLPYKKMRTLFKKYHAFETTYGDEETILHVTSLLREYSEQ